MSDKILIADDVEVNCLYLRGLLEAHGYDVLEAPDGEIALALVRRHRPDLAIIDVSMPKVDGFEFVRRLRAEPEIGQTRVLLWSASDIDQPLREFALHHAVGLLDKPCEPGRILQTIKQSLHADKVSDLCASITQMSTNA